MGDLNEWCKHDTLAAYCGDCMIELRADLSAVKQQRDELASAGKDAIKALEYYIKSVPLFSPGIAALTALRNALAKVKN